MFCAKCGSELPENALFCGECGNKVEIPDDAHMEKLEETKGSQGKPEQQAAQLSGGESMGLRQPYQPSVQNQSNAWTGAGSVSVITKVLIAECVIFAILAFVCYIKVKEYTSPEIVAKSYFTAVMAGDPKKAYDLIDVDESEFVNEKYFGKLLKEIGQKNVYNFKVDNMKNTDNQDFQKTVKISYRLKEDTSDYSFDVQVEKTSSKKYFLFDDWKVNIGDYIQKDVMLYVYNESKVKFDGADLNKKYLSDTEKEGTSQYVQYVIPKIFNGTYETVITNDIYADCRMSLDINETNTIFFEGEDDVAVRQEVIKKIAKQSQEDFKALWNGAAQLKSFDKLDGIQMIEDNSDIKEEYEELKGMFGKDNSARLLKVDFDNFEIVAEAQNENDLEYASIDVDFSAPFSVTSLYENWWSGELESSEDSGYYEGYIGYLYEDGEWLLSGVTLADDYNEN